MHFGAISDTTASDADLVLANNFRLPLRLLDWCTNTRTRFIYSSSAATYGDGSAGFRDDWSPTALEKLKPMNPMAGASSSSIWLWSIASPKKLPPQWAGLKFFNVYGPNEYHKGAMASVLAKVFDGAKAGQSVRCSNRTSRG